MTLDLTRELVYAHNGINSSEYNANEYHQKKNFVYTDTYVTILKWLVRLWRKRYDYKPTDSHFKNFEAFFSEFEKKHKDIVNQFRNYKYNFEVKRITLSSS